MYCPKCSSQQVKIEPNPSIWKRTNRDLYVVAQVDGEVDNYDEGIRESHCLDCKYVWYDSDRVWEWEN
jgi:hypothetical protein